MNKKEQQKNLEQRKNQCPNDDLRGSDMHNILKGGGTSKMKNIYLFGIIAILLIFTAGTFVYAHNTSTPETVQDSLQGDDYKYMDQMHQEIVKQIDDPELVDVMNEMHEGCMQTAKGNEYTTVRDKMIGGMR